MKPIAICYGKYNSPLQKRAVEELSWVLLKMEAGLASCFPAENAPSAEEFRRIFVGTREDNPVIAAKNFDLPKEPEGYGIFVEEDTVYIAGVDEAGTVYGCVDFYNQYLLGVEYDPLYNEHHGKAIYPEVLPDFAFTSAPKIRQRGIWTWGHVIYDYRGFFDNMLRSKFNTVIIWNDFVPVNAKDMIEYAHQRNIRVIWGYSWCWDTDCARYDLRALDKETDDILEKYEREYADLGGDGIYFQSFTELKQEEIGGVLIAQAVTDFVNRTAGRLLEKHPGLELQFGLHATSVKEKLSYLEKVDPRVRIVWEDCGAFPFAYSPKNVENFDETVAFAEKITRLRGAMENFGVVTKGMTTLDWGKFEHLRGQFVLGGQPEAVIQGHQRRKTKKWRYFQAIWLANAPYALKMVQVLRDATGGDLCFTALIEDGIFEREIPYPAALFAEMLWDCDRECGDLLTQVALRDSVRFY